MKVSINSAIHIGARHYQEDEILIDDKGRFLIAAIFDGHGGHTCSTFLKDNLASAFQKHMPRSHVPVSKRYIEAALQWLHLEWYTQHQNDQSGSTLTGILIDQVMPKRVWVFNLGDSQTVIFEDKSIVFATQNHDLSLSRQEEVLRKAPYAYISTEWGQTRLYGHDGALNLSGAYGNTHDLLLKKTLLRDPEVNSVDVVGNNTIVIGSDGLWDDLSIEDVMHIVSTSNVSINHSERILDQVKRRGRKGDNAAIITLNIFN